MKNFSIIPMPANEEGLPDSLHIRDGRKDFAIIFSTGEVTFMPRIDYLIEELEYLIKISNLFYSIFNSVKTNNYEFKKVE